MSELLAIVAVAGLFTGFALLERRRSHRDCGSCAHADSEACEACPVGPTRTRG